MKAYKFRSADNLHFVVDILFNKRLYCCRADQLNDIREGDLRVGNDGGRELQVIEYGDAVSTQLKELRVCALTTSFDNHLLWAHYADGWSGVAIEVEVDDADAVAVTYADDFIYLAQLMESLSPEAAARQALARKYKEWSYEGEVRLITKSEYYTLKRPISRVIVGSRTSPALVSALHVMCNHFGITLDRVVVADWGLYTVGAQPMHL
jgi:hypothetical protein